MDRDRMIFIIHILCICFTVASWYMVVLGVYIKMTSSPYYAMCLCISFLNTFIMWKYNPVFHDIMDKVKDKLNK